jgi:multidrug efflux pump subunit AcrB
MARFAIRYPYLVLVACLVLVVLGLTTLLRMPVDLFPEVKIPVVVVATFYPGMPPEQIESGITSRFERFFTLAGGIDRIESRSLPGVSLIKIIFKPGTDADSAVSGISNLAMANLRRLPAGTLPPVVLKFDASSLPVCLITLSGEGLDETQLRDLGQFNIRNQVAGAPGASVPQPFGGKYRQIMVYVDPMKLQSRQLSLMDVVTSLQGANTILPGGNVVIGPTDYTVQANGQLNTVNEIARVPLKVSGTAQVLVADVARVKDGAAIQSNIVRINGQRSVYLPVLKQGGGIQHDRGGEGDPQGRPGTHGPATIPSRQRRLRPVLLRYRRDHDPGQGGYPWPGPHGRDDPCLSGERPRDHRRLSLHPPLRPGGLHDHRVDRRHRELHDAGRTGARLLTSHR